MTTDRVRVEACVTTVLEARTAVVAGAHRVELCRELETGGLTPGLDLLVRVRSAVAVPVFAMVRPVGGPFLVGAAGAERMLRDASACVEAGADGLVAGALDGDDEVDAGLMRELVAVAAGRPVTFHRAFDQTPHPLRALERLVNLGVARILTSGGPESAWAGRHGLRDLVRASGGRVSVVAGGSVRADHVARLIDETGVGEVHARAEAVPDLVRALG